MYTAIYDSNKCIRSCLNLSKLEVQGEYATVSGSFTYHYIASNNSVVKKSVLRVQPIKGSTLSKVVFVVNLIGDVNILFPGEVEVMLQQEAVSLADIPEVPLDTLYVMSMAVFCVFEYHAY